MNQIARAGQAELEVRHSRFIGYALPCADEETAAARIAELRSEHPRATHHVYAWRLHDPRSHKLTHRFDDDGEPGGTAGRPVLAALEARGAVDALCVVVRYFGGVKLGAGRLTRSYGQAAALALQAAELRPLIAYVMVRISVPFASLSTVEALLAREGIAVRERTFADRAQFVIALPQEQRESFARRLNDLTAGNAAIEDLDSGA